MVTNKGLVAIAVIVVSWIVVAMALQVNGGWIGTGNAETDAGIDGLNDPSPAMGNDTGPVRNDTEVQDNDTIFAYEGKAGSSVSPRFLLDPGIAVFHIEYSGDTPDGIFEVALASVDGDSWQLLVDPAGHVDGTYPAAYDGDRLVGVAENGTSWTAPGWYEVQVTADGPWSIAAERPTNVSAGAVPCTLFGNTSEVVAVEVPESDITFGLDYGNGSSMRGGGYIGVWLYDEEGNFVDSVFVETGAFNGTRTMTFSFDCTAEMEIEDMCPPKPGTYWLEIVGDYGGDWTLTITT